MTPTISQSPLGTEFAPPSVGTRLAIAAIAVVIGLAVPHLANHIVVWTRLIPDSDPLADYVTGVAWSLLLGIGIVFWPVRLEDKPRLVCAWMVRCAVVLGLALLFENHYGLADSYGYFVRRTQTPSFSALITLSPKVGTQNIFALSWLHQQFLPDSYRAMKVSFAAAGFMAVYIFYRAGIAFLGREEPRLFYALSYYPSIVFWSSILGKDPVVLLGIAIYTYGVILWYRNDRFAYLLLATLGVLIAATIRLWLVPILIAPLGFLQYGRTTGIAGRAVILGGSIAAIRFSFGRVMQIFAVESATEFVSRAEFLAQASDTGASAGGALPQFTGLGGMVKYAPLGMFTALFRPLPGEVMNPFGIVAGLEDLVLLWLLWRALIKGYSTKWNDLKDPLVGWAILLTAIWAFVYGFISQNLGTGSRYKLQVLPVLVGLLLYVGRSREAVAS